TAWLLAGAVALGLLALIVIGQSLLDGERLSSVYRPLSSVLGIGAVAALVVGWARPAPWPPGSAPGSGPVGAVGVRCTPFPERRRMGRCPRRGRLSANSDRARLPDDLG